MQPKILFCNIGWMKYYNGLEGDDITGDLAALKKRFLRYRRIMRGVTGRVYRAALVLENDLQFDESLRYGEDMPVEEIARALHLPRGTVSTRISRGLKMLRAQIEKEAEGID